MSMRDKKVFWNTRCMYTEHGQRMGAFWDGTHVHYADIDRMCHGSFRCSNVDSEYFLKEYVQLVYDRPIGHRSCTLPSEELYAFEAEIKAEAPSLKHDGRVYSL